MSSTTPKLGLTKMALTDTMSDWVNAHNGNAEILDGILGLVYPVGAIYMSVNNTSPATLFGGTWEALGGRFLIGANSTYVAGTTGGSASASYTPAGSVGNHTLTASEIPSHAHGLNSHKHSVGAHSHGLNSHTHGLNSHTHSVGAHSHGLNSHKHSYNAPANHTHSVSGSAYFGYSSGLPGGQLNAIRTTSISVGSCTHIYGDANTGSKVEFNKSGSADRTITTGIEVGGTAASNGASSSTNTGAASGSTENSTVFNTGAASGSTAAASGNTADSTAFDSGAASGNTAAAGGGGAHNHGFTGTAATIATMPPYLSVYMWKRTA